LEVSNPTAQKLFGKNLADFYDNDFSAILSDEDTDGLIGHFEQVIQTGIEYEARHTVPGHDGEDTKTINLRIFKMSGDRLGVIFEDITMRQQMESELRSSEALYRTLFEKANDAIFIMQGDKFVDCNSPTLQMFGCQKEDIINQPPFKFSPAHQPDGRDSKEKGLEKIVAALDGKPQRFEWKHCRLDRSEFDAEISLNRMILEEEIFILAIVRDITDRKFTEQSLIDAEHEKIVILDSLVEHVVYQDIDNRILWVNQAACDSLERERHDLIGNKCYELWHGRTEPCTACPVIQARETGQRSQCEVESPDGRIWFICGCPVHDRDGNIIGVIETTLEITEKKKAERQEAELRKRLERAGKMESLGILAGGVAHDLNNMLGPMVGYSDLLLMKLDEGDPIRRQVQRIGKSAQDAADVIQDLLTLARRGRYEMVPTNLNEVIETYLDSPGFGHMHQTRSAVTIEKNLDGKISNIVGSAPHLSKVVMNLIVNAIDAMPGGGSLAIQTSQQHLKKLLSGYGNIEEGEYIIFRVCDSGVGINPEDCHKIFEPYYSKKKMGASGSGLGLAVVYGIIKDHKGYYDVMSEVNQGTEFIIYLPVTREGITNHSLSQDNCSGTETILIVDDIEEQRQLAVDMLTTLGYRTCTAANGHEALSYLADHSVDLVVVDMIMEKGFDGLDTYRGIIKIHPGQKAIIVSGFSATERANEMQKLGAGPYIKKPYSLSVIGKAVREELDRKGTDSGKNRPGTNAEAIPASGQNQPSG
jgi:PAS domain S-box-containing protein